MKMTFQEIRIIATAPCIANQLRDVNTICRRSWYIAAHIWNRSRTRFHDKNWQNRSPMVRKKKIYIKDHKGLRFRSYRYVWYVNKKSKTTTKKNQNIEKHTDKYIQKINTQNKKIQTHKTQRQHIVWDIHIICTIYVILTK